MRGEFIDGVGTGMCLGIVFGILALVLLLDSPQRIREEATDTAMRQAAIDAARGTMRYEAKLVEQPDGTTKWVVTPKEPK